MYFFGGGVSGTFWVSFPFFWRGAFYLWKVYFSLGMSCTLCFRRLNFSNDVKFTPFSNPSSNFNIYNHLTDFKFIHLFFFSLSSFSAVTESP